LIDGLKVDSIAMAIPNVNTLNESNNKLKRVETCIEMEFTYSILTVVKTSMLVFWVVTPCGLVGKKQRLGRT
jgi:hypothetical protein